MEDIQNTSEVVETSNEPSLFEDAPETNEENLFDDVETEEAKPSNSEETETVEETPHVEEPFMRIKYNKEELGLTKEEAIDLAEKGKNYDSLRDKFNARNSVLEQLAKRSNMDVNQFLKTLEDTRDRIDLDNEVNELRKTYPNMDNNALTELAQYRLKDRQNIQHEKAVEEQQKQQTEVDLRKNEIKKQVQLFNKRYPNLKADQLDKSVYDMMDNDGYTLLEAYTIFKENQSNSQKTSSSKVDQLKESNKRRSLGNITNTGEVEVDDFIKGFNSEF